MWKIRSRIQPSQGCDLGSKDLFVGKNKKDPAKISEDPSGSTINLFMR
jgi:hypothetical protein